jgi:ribosomal protein S18 acetylase RimI-like enzyme
LFNKKLMIRSFRKSDQEKLIEIFNLNVPEFFDPAELTHFIEYLRTSAETYLTIESEGRIVGGVGYEIRESDRSGRINWIFIHPDFSNLGFGTKGVNHCLMILRSNHNVEILIVRTSQLAYKFFERLGYKVTKTEKDYWGKGLDLYLMTQEISAPAD